MATVALLVEYYRSMLSDVYVRSAQEHYEGFKLTAEPLLTAEALRDKDTLQRIGQAVTKAADTLVAVWAGPSFGRAGNEGSFDDYLDAEAELLRLTRQQTPLYLAQAQALAKSKLAYKHMRHIWHEEAIIDTHAAEAELDV